jgi:hypothetical protein
MVRVTVSLASSITDTARVCPLATQAVWVAESTATPHRVPPTGMVWVTR